MSKRSDLSKFELVVHATHEAGIKTGGIGAALDGILSSGSYLLGVQRTILVGPMNTRDDIEMERLVSSSNMLDVLYSSYHGLDNLDRRLSAAWAELRRERVPPTTGRFAVMRSTRRYRRAPGGNRISMTPTGRANRARCSAATETSAP